MSGDTRDKNGVENRSRGRGRGTGRVCLPRLGWPARMNWARTALDRPSWCNKACLFAMDQLAMRVPKFCLFAYSMCQFSSTNSNYHKEKFFVC